MLFPCNDTVACYFVSCILPRELCVSSTCIHYCKKICDCVNYTATDWFSLLCTMGWILYMCLQLWIKYTIEDKDQVSNMKSKKRSTSPQWNTYTVDHRSYTMGATSIHINGEASGDKLMRFGICEIGNILSSEKSSFSIQNQHLHKEPPNSWMFLSLNYTTVSTKKHTETFWEDVLY